MKLLAVIGGAICVFTAHSSLEQAIFLAAMLVCMAMPERHPAAQEGEHE